tara:strand:- start:347 stop:1150 length:804 start_codon:yes stop_codon:yes gene_type:complete
MNRARLRGFFESPVFNNYILILILINSAIIGLLTFDFSESKLLFLDSLDQIILMIFILEMLFKLYAYGTSFFDNSWNIFDLSVVLVSSIPAVYSFSVMRVFRVFKLLRIIRVFPELRKMVEATFRSIKGILAITTILWIVIYVYAIMCHMLFGQPGEPGEQYFGNLGRSLFSLFQIMTLDAWADGMVRELMDYHGSWVGVFFGFFILSTTFTFLNMFIALFTNTMASIDIEDGDNVGFSRIVNEIRDELKQIIRNEGYPVPNITEEE